MNPLTLLDLAGRADFLAGLWFGFIATIVVVVSWGRIPWGVVFAVAGGAALTQVGNSVNAVWAPPIAALLALAAALIAGLGARRLSTRVPPWTIILMLSISTLGVWGTVPETEHARIVLGVAVGLLPAAFVARRGWGLAIGAGLAGVLLGVVAAIGGTPRPGSVIGAVGCLGILLVAGTAHRVEWGVPPWAVLVGHVLLVVTSGRLVGQISNPGAAALILVVVLVAARVGMESLERRWNPAADNSEDPSFT